MVSDELSGFTHHNSIIPLSVKCEQVHDKSGTKTTTRLFSSLCNIIGSARLYLMGFENKNKQQYVGFLILLKDFLDGP